MTDIRSARSQAWRTIVVNVWDEEFLAGEWWRMRPAWLCPHGTVWVGAFPPDACKCPPAAADANPTEAP